MEESNIPEEIIQVVNTWLSGPYDEDTKKEILHLQETNQKELIDAFSKTLSFGTGGMREIMGVGTNRINIYTIYFATQGLANYLIGKNSDRKPLSVVIGYDSRHNSKEFALAAGRCLAGNGIKAFVFPDISPTPLVSFTCRYKKSDAAIMITASHNPKEYNGYKVYGKDGAQVVNPDDEQIVAEVEKIKDMGSVKLAHDTHPLIEYLSVDIEDTYTLTIKKLQIHPKELISIADDLTIIYTSLHGAGTSLMKKALKEWGFNHLSLVEEQCIPDGNFPTVKKPNPEELEALSYGLKQMKEKKGDLLIATDPDADRVGIVAMHKGRPYIFSGNQIASICVYYILSSFSQLGIIPGKPAVIKTIVTTDLFKDIASHFHVQCIDVLTGFKYIAKLIHQWEKGENPHTFLFGAEESYGYLFGTHARDKDAIISSCLIAEFAALLKAENKTLVDLLYELYEQFGAYKEAQISINFENHEKNRLNKLMETLRASPPKEIDHLSVTQVIDYLKNQDRPSHIPSSDVLIFKFADNMECIIRPSGTEPKVKIYGFSSRKVTGDVEDAIDKLDERLKRLLESFKRYCLSIS